MGDLFMLAGLAVWGFGLLSGNILIFGASIGLGASCFFFSGVLSRLDAIKKAIESNRIKTVHVSQGRVQ